MADTILALAPMAGITDWPMRLLCVEQGCNYTTTEMVSAQGFLQAPDSLKIYHYLLAIHPDEPKPVVQIFGHREDYMAEAAARLSNTGLFSGVDINMGCPAQKVVTSGAGSAMMRDPEGIGAVVRALSGATKLPVTAKIRSGWDADSVNAAEVARICEGSGASAGGIAFCLPHGGAQPALWAMPPYSLQKRWAAA